MYKHTQREREGERERYFMVCDDNLILILSARVDADCFSLYFCYGALFTCDFKRSLQLLISPPHQCSGRCIARSYTRLNYHRNSIVLFFILQPYTFVLFSINTHAVIWLKYCPHNVKHHQSIHVHVCTQYL